MNLTLRQRIVLTLLPLLALLAGLGAAGFVMLSRLGGRIDQILRENYDSVIYMERLNEALERIDSAYTFALAGREEFAHRQYGENWIKFDEFLGREQQNITLEGEGELVEELMSLRNEYRRQGDVFFYRPKDPARDKLYFGPDQKSGLYGLFLQIKDVSGKILRINQENMEEASRDARKTARNSLLLFGSGLGITGLLALVLARQTLLTILRPVRAVTESAQAIGKGDLDQVVPVTSGDELGQLAAAFNTMARQLRGYRQSQHAHLQRLQKTTQAALDSFPHPVLLVDPQGRVELANPAARRVLGLPTSGGGAAPVLPWQPIEPLREPVRQALVEQRAYQPEGFDQAFAVRSGADDHFFLPRVLPIRDSEGTTLGAAVLLEDITRFRLLDEVKSNLVATVSHELKTPLTGIRLAVHLLLEETVGPLSPKQLELLLDARDNTERLLAMINNLLDLARLQESSGKLDRRPVLPAALLRTAADTARPRAEDKGIELHLDVPADVPLVAVDAGQFGHALDNLLDNALRFTDRGGRVTLSAETSGDSVTFSVSDTGAGIPPEFLPHVFERFFRVPGQGSEHGTGLGLAIVREIVTAHGGRVSVDSRLHEGTAFRLTLPVWTDAGHTNVATAQHAW